MSKLSELLRSARNHKGSTLREVEESTGISNAYLSQIEKGKVKRPSPNKLKKLSKFYCMNYSKILESAGYADDLQEVNKSHSEIVDFLLSQEITDQEAKALTSFLKTYRELSSAEPDC